MDTRKELLAIVADYVDIPVDTIDTSLGIKFSTGMDSFVLLSMVAAIEEQFNIRISAEKLSELKTLDDFIVLTDQLRAN